jgi:hypothetical protein
VDETTLGNHDSMLSHLALSRGDPRNDPTEMISKYVEGKPLVEGCRVWHVGNNAVAVQDNTALVDELTTGSLTGEPMRVDDMVMSSISDINTNRKYGSVLSVEEHGVQTSFESSTGVPGQVENGPPVSVPAAELTTGDPITQVTLGVSFDILRERIRWSWPAHINAEDISFQAEGGLKLRDSADTSALTIGSMAEEPMAHPHGNTRYMKGAFEVVIGDEVWQQLRSLRCLFLPLTHCRTTLSSYSDSCWLDLLYT